MLKYGRSTVAYAVLGTVVVWLVASVATRAADVTQFPRVDYLTFRAPVALPGVTLGSGEYSFEANYVDSGNVVRVRHRSSHRLVFMGMTQRVHRPDGVADGSVTLGEARPGEAPPVLVWYPTSNSLGFEFIYPER